MLTISELQLAVEAWSKRNFPDSPWQYALAGVVEEIGELSHSVLKMAQGIRGSRDKHLADAKDAVADTAIYLADYLCKIGFQFANGVTFAMFQDEARKLGNDDGDTPVNKILVTAAIAGRLIEEPNDDNAMLLLAGLADVSESLGIDFQNAVETTWNEVSTRDWQANRVNGQATRES